MKPGEIYVPSGPPARPVYAPTPDSAMELDTLNTGAPAESGDPGLARRPFSPGQLLRYRWSMLLTFLLLSVVSVGGIWLVIAPEYEATAIVEVSPVIPKLVGGNSDMVPLYESYRTSQVDYITSSVVLDRVLDRMSRSEKLRRTAWYRDTPTTPLERWLAKLDIRQPRAPGERLMSDLTAQAPRYKQLVYVSLKARTPGEAKLVVDTVLDEYVRFVRQRASDSDRDLMRQLRKEISDRELDLRGLEDRAASVRAQLGTGAPQDLVTQQVLRLDELEFQIHTLETDIELAERFLKLADTEQSQDNVTATTEVPAPRFDDDAEWRQLSGRLEAAERDVERGQRQYGEAHPRMVELHEAVEAAQGDLTEHEDRLRSRAALSDQGPEGLRQNVRAMKTRLEVLRRLVEQERGRFDLVATDAEMLTQLQARREKTETMQQQLVERLEVMEMNREVAGLIRALPASEPASPTVDKRLKLTAAALAASFGLAIGLAFLRVRMNPTFEEADEVSRPTPGLFLGHIPLGRGQDADDPDASPLLLEAVRVVRTSLLARLPSGGRVVQVTSAAAGAGKSTLTRLLARSLAECGQRVLLVDSDMHRPTLGERFKIKSEPGLIDVLAGRATEDETIRATSLPTLHLLPCGRSVGHADSEVLAREGFVARLAEWRRRYDIVLLDSAPLLLAADAAIVAGRADGTVFVVRERHCRRVALAEALSLLSASGGRLLGTVYVGSHVGGAYAYGYRYGTYYGHGNGSGASREAAMQLLDVQATPAQTVPAERTT